MDPDDIIKDLLSDEGFARRVDAELDLLGYPRNHVLRLAAQARFKTNTMEGQGDG